MLPILFNLEKVRKAFGGLIFLNKPSGISSQSALTQVRRRFNLKKIGHGGTLDPLAEGLLVCAVGEATKFLSYSAIGEKTYLATGQLGFTSDTEDCLGKKIVSTASLEQINSITEKKISDILHQFVGTQLQKPPNYSALKHQGKCRYVYARRNEIIPDPIPRQIHIRQIDQISYNTLEKTFSFQVQCSSGTYVRSLVRDIGEKLGSGALLSKLTRTGAEPFSLAEAFDLEEILKMSPEYFFCQAMVSIERLCQKLPSVIISLYESSDLSLGRSISIDLNEEILSFSKEGSCTVAVFEKTGLFCGVGEVHIETNRLQPKRWLSNFQEQKQRCTDQIF